MFKLAIFVAFAATLANCVPQNYYFTNHYETAPYQPSGWRPSGAAFRLPERQQVPQTIYGPPQVEYGPPEPSTTEAAEATTTEIPTTTEVSTEEAESENLNDKLEDAEQGAYYVFHPSGLLQKVTFATKDDFKNMAYYAKIKYEDVKPIKAPIFTYDPDTSVLRRIARKA